jgi:hypothetical protein
MLDRSTTMRERGRALFRFDPAAGAGEFHDFDLRQESIGDIAFSADAALVQAIGPFLMELDPANGAIQRGPCPLTWGPGRWRRRTRRCG